VDQENVIDTRKNQGIPGSVYIQVRGFFFPENFFNTMNFKNLIFLAEIFFVFSLISCGIKKQRPISALIFMGPGTLLYLAAIGLRYYRSWPMLPMYLGIPALVCCLAVLWLLNRKRYLSEQDCPEEFFLRLLIVLLGLLPLFFPKDFYLPFIRSVTIWSHLFFISGTVAKGFLLLGALRGAVFLRKKHSPLESAMSAVFSGFILLTLSIFCGEVWAYLGWGTPIVWHDAAITTTMALWFYWTCVLHLHYSTTWKKRSRAWMMAGGGILLIALCSPSEMGPFRMMELMP
jgi:hypothetical protein